MNDMRTKVWSKLKYKKPKDWLIELNRIQKEIIPKVADERARKLRTNRLKWIRESRQAAILTYGMEQFTGRVINFALDEDDHDFIARFIEDDVDTYVPVQLKELVPEDTNPTQTLDNLFDGLHHYSNQSDFTVGIYLSRNVVLDIEKIRLQGTNFKEVWLFGACTSDLKKWFILGDIQKEPQYFEFDYPVEKEIPVK